MKCCTNNQGFSLAELLVVLVIMGLVTVAVYGTFLSTQRQAYTQDEVVEVQQNLRVALDFMVKDIRMAEFLNPEDESALASAPNQMLIDGNSDGDYDDAGERPLLSLVSATSMNGYARVISEPSTGTLKLASDTQQQFAAADLVRVFRPVDMAPVTEVLSISSLAGDDQVVLDLTGATYAAGDVSAGDLLVRMPAGAADDDFPLQIDYQLVDDPSDDVNMNQLQRRVLDQSGNVVEDFQLIASNISGITLAYLDDAGDTTGDLDEVVAIEITMTAQTDMTRTGNSNFSGVKVRSLSTTAKIHNGVVL